MPACMSLCVFVCACKCKWWLTLQKRTAICSQKNRKKKIFHRLVCQRSEAARTDEYLCVNAPVPI